ncbi:MAG TPA: hypothetical protein VK671_08425, partial [Mucilaginibacter sp.]|nr:hypothetical protein [Mucilaginibacter sp.]
MAKIKIMKKLSTLTILFIFFNLIQANSQTPDWVWARSAQSGITGWGEAVSIATDQSENIFVAGQYRDTIIFGSHVLTGAQEGVYLTKYDTYGNIKWAKGDISANILNCWTGGICTDSSGNCYLVGYFNDTVSFDSFTLISSGINDAIFLVKYDPSGNVLWAKSAGGSGMDDCYGVTTDPWGNIYLTGNYGSSLFVLDWDTLINTGSGTNIFVAKYDSSGNLLWAKNAVGTGQDRGYSVATDVLGNVILTGSFYSHIITFGPYVLNHVNGSGANIFVVKYDSSGNILWANKAGGTNDDIAYHVITDALGNIYVTGYFSSWPMLFGTDTLFLAGNVDVFLVKYNPFGSIAWVKSFGNDSEEGYCVTTDKYGRIYLTGFFHSTITIDTIPLQL